MTTSSRAGKAHLANALMPSLKLRLSQKMELAGKKTQSSSDEHAKSWKHVTVAILEQRTPIFLELWHCGWAFHNFFPERDKLPVTPSPGNLIANI